MGVSSTSPHDLQPRGLPPPSIPPNDINRNPRNPFADPTRPLRYRQVDPAAAAVLPTNPFTDSRYPIPAPPPTRENNTVFIPRAPLIDLIPDRPPEPEPEHASSSTRIHGKLSSLFRKSAGDGKSSHHSKENSCPSLPHRHRSHGRHDSQDRMETLETLEEALVRTVSYDAAAAQKGKKSRSGTALLDRAKSMRKPWKKAK